MMFRTIGIVIFTMAVGACSATGVNQRDKNVTIDISYGTIKSTEAVNLKSEAGKSAAIGGRHNRSRG